MDWVVARDWALDRIEGVRSVAVMCPSGRWRARERVMVPMPAPMSRRWRLGFSGGSQRWC